MKIGDIVEIVKENNEDSTRYVGKWGRLAKFVKETVFDTTGKKKKKKPKKVKLFLVEIDPASGDKGTCLARKVKAK